MRMGQSGMHMGSLYGYIHMGDPICVWAKYSYGLEQPHNQNALNVQCIGYCVIEHHG